MTSNNQNREIRYVDLNVRYDKPYVWKKPLEKRIPKGGKSYLELAKEIADFNKLKEGAKGEIISHVKKAIDFTNTKDQLNKNLNETFESFAKAVIPDPDADPQFLLKKTNKNTLNKKLQPWCKNLVYNIPEVRQTKPYKNLIGKFKGMPAIVNMAGPSLKNNRELLRKAKGKALIIAVDTSIRPLLDVGVTPDIVVTHDANPNGCKFFLSGEHELNKNNANLNDLDDNRLALTYALLKKDKERLKFSYDTVGLFVNYVHPITSLCFNGSDKAFYGVHDPNLPVYNVMAGACNYRENGDGFKYEDKGAVVGGSSVGHVATYIAVALGCDPIVLNGLDLSYPGGNTYIEGSSNQKDATRQKLVEKTDISGNIVKTNLSMLSYKMVFERGLPNIIAQTGIRFYNCTTNHRGEPTGILEIGAEPKSLDWVIDEYCKENRNINVKEVLNSEREQKK